MVETSPQPGSIMLSHALAYLRQGYSVVQLFAGGKRPIGQWMKYQSIRASEQEIVDQWKEHPDANIGIICGRISGIVVIDVDPRNGGSVEEWERRLPKTLSVVTGSGGRHFYFRSDITVKKAKLADGVDLQGEGSLVVAPPSRHESGNTYKLLDDTPIAAFPQDLAQRSHNSEEKTKTLDKTWVHALLTNGASEGERNQATNKLAGYLLAKNIPVDIVKTIMLDWNRTRNFPSLSDDEISRTVESTNRTRLNNDSQWLQMTADMLKVEYNDETEPISLMRLDSFMRKYGGEELRWAVDGWLPQSAIIMAAALPGTFKTWLSFDIALSIATGSKFLGQFKPQTRGGVILLQHEDAFPMMAERMAAIIASKHPEIIQSDAMDGNYSAQAVDQEIPIYFEPARKFKLHTEDYVHSLARQIQARNVKLVVIDPLYAMLDKNDEYGKDLGLMIRERLKPIRDLTGCSFLLIHHAKKSESQNIIGDRTGSWGSVYLDAATEGSWQMRRIPGDKKSIVVSPFFKSMGSSDPVKLTFDIDTKSNPPKFDVASETLSGDAAEVFKNTQYGVITDDLVEFCDIQPRTVAEISENFNIPRQRASELIRKLESAGKLRKDGSKVASVPPQMKLPKI